MAKTAKQDRPKPRLPKGLRDIEAAEIRGVKEMLRTIETVYESYGFEPVETPMIEYTDALGKFLPDQDRPNEGVFSFQDDDEKWLSLRYDLTAPLARYVAENYQDLPKPYRSYRSGWVFRNEKPGPGRYRQFMQFDADTVGTSSPAADAEICMLAADTLEALGIARGDYVIKFNSRQILDGVMETIGIAGEGCEATRMAVMRAIDKLDRLGVIGVEQLLGEERKDESGDITKGAGLNQAQIVTILGVIEPDRDVEDQLASIDIRLAKSETGQEGLRAIEDISKIVRAAGYGADRIRIDPTVVRGLEYYTGAVFEAELTFETTDETGRPVRFGSVGGGGRYDDLVARFRGELVPATGFSIGVSRLYAALKALGRVEEGAALAPVVVLVMDRERIGEHQRLVSELRNAGVRAELYLGTSGMKAQMKYADKRGAPCVVIQGDDERARGEVQVKDLVHGAQMAEGIDSREEWREARPAQISVPEAEMVSAVKDVLARHAR
ncbi:MAG TPA: histidine--tRNA ligase [Aestuariivirgaceae bacterium]|nr:histidine--tRNA ligase [Aestuariivirgaceae bacterium]